MNDYRNPNDAWRHPYYNDESRCRSSYIAIAVCAVLLILTIFLVYSIMFYAIFKGC